MKGEEKKEEEEGFIPPMAVTWIRHCFKSVTNVTLLYFYRSINGVGGTLTSPLNLPDHIYISLSLSTINKKPSKKKN